jgi:hypothetical protein
MLHVVEPPEFVTVTVQLPPTGSSAVGTPVRAPVVVLKDKPAGGVLSIEKVRTAPPAIEALFRDGSLFRLWPRVKVIDGVNEPSYVRSDGATAFTVRFW